MAKSIISLSIVVWLMSLQALAQQKMEDTTEYVSNYDNSLTLNNVTYLPSVDNVNGVYSKAINEKLKELIEKNHKWNFVTNHTTSATIKP